MCRKFGPRCTPSAKASLAAAKRRVKEANTPDQKIKAEEAALKAEFEYYCTTGGLRYLTNKIEETGDANGRYASLLERAKESRALRIALSKEFTNEVDDKQHLPLEEDAQQDEQQRAAYAMLEENVANALKKGEVFSLGGQTFVSLGSGKPIRSGGGGEPKTDVYAVARDATGKEIELKISCKKSNADFLENKVNKERFSAIVGDTDMHPVLSQAVETFSSRPTYVQSSKRHPVRDENGEVTGYEDVYLLGYRMDIMNKPGLNYIPWKPSREQLMEIYAGTNLPDTKRNAIVPGINGDKPVKNSGVANMILVGDEFTDAQDIVNNAVPLKRYVEENDTVYFAFKGVNYRSVVGRWDSNRPLGMHVLWTKNDKNELQGRLDSSAIMFDKDANTIGNGLLDLLRKK